MAFYIPVFGLEIKDLHDAVSILAAMITPALLISATGTFILSTSNRLSRVVDRLRFLSQRLEEAFEFENPSPHQEARTALWRAHLVRQKRRLNLLQAALTLLYCAAAVFVLTSVSIGLIGSLSMHLSWMPVALGLAGASFLLAASVLLILEARQAVHNAVEETEFVQHRVSKKGD